MTPGSPAPAAAEPPDASAQGPRDALSRRSGVGQPGILEIWIVPADDLHGALSRRLGGREPRRTSTGKPWLEDGPHFNISHSGELGLLAVCPDRPVGVDLEADRSLRNPDGLARRMCSPRELDIVAAAEDATATLLWLWVRKEAVAKAEGGGIATALSGIDVLDPIVLCAERRFHLIDLPAPAPGYRAAVAWQDGPPDPAGPADAAQRPIDRP